MEKSGAASYVYAKAAGMLKKAFIGENAVKLFNAESVAGIWEMVFKTRVPVLPESMLATKLEKDAVNLFISQYINLLETYDKPDQILVQLLRRYEVENIKAITAALSYGEKTHPHCMNLGIYSSLDYSQWPDIKKITEGSEFSWISEVPEGEERQRMDFNLDLQDYKGLWRSLDSVKDGSKSVLKEYFSEAYAIKNLIWALRLKIYYKYDDEKIIRNLYYFTDSPSPSDPICVYAYEIFGRKTDSYDDWKNWRFAKYLNPHEEGVVWSINPMWLEQRFKVVSIGREIKLFHQYPMTDLSLVMFFRLKRQELDFIRAATEALRLGTDKGEAMYVAGILDKFGDTNGKNR